MAASRDSVMQDLIEREKAVAVKVDAARAEAERIVAQARSEARDLLERARAEAEQLMGESAERAARQAGEARDRAVGDARDAAAALLARAEQRREAAVRALMDLVLP